MVAAVIAAGFRPRNNIKLFKDLHKLVYSHSQQQNIRKELFQTLQNRTFWIWYKEEYKQEDIKTNGDCSSGDVIELPQKTILISQWFSTIKTCHLLFCSLY
jgi:hypothetical protein